MNDETYILSGAIEAAILGLATNDEQALYHAMRALHPQVLAYASAFEEKLEEDMLANSTLVPKENTFEKIKTNIATLTTAPVVPIMNNTPVVGINRYKQYAVAACVALLIGSILTNITLLSKVKNVQEKYTTLSKAKDALNEQYAFLKNKDMLPIALDAVAQGIAVQAKSMVYFDKNANMAKMVVQSLPNAPANKDYQLWAIVEGKPVSLGVLKIENDKLILEIKNVPNKATQFAVTLEDAGGKPTPNLEQLYLSGKINT